MDLALFAVIISAVVLVLQIVTLARIASMRKAIDELKSAPQPASSHGNDRDRQGRRDNEFRRHDRRPFHDQKQRPQQQQSGAAPQATAVASEGIEKSLRDINLRLKNAERDQESARRSIQENMPRDQQFRNRDEHRNRDDRGRNRGGRDRNDRHGNRDNRRGNWQDRRDRQDRPAQQQSQNQPTLAEQSDAPADASLFEPKTAPSFDSTPAQEAMVAPAAQEVQATDVGSDDELQHGRKIVFKRRPLSGDDSTMSTDQNATDGADASAAPMSQEGTITVSDTPDTEIKFGRR